MGRRHAPSYILCAMRILAACSLGGAGHFNPLVPFLRAARRRGDEVLTVGPPALREMVESAGFPSQAGSEPSEEQVAAIKERLPLAARPRPRPKRRCWATASCSAG